MAKILDPFGTERGKIPCCDPSHASQWVKTADHCLCLACKATVPEECFSLAHEASLAGTLAKYMATDCRCKKP